MHERHSPPASALTLADDVQVEIFEAFTNDDSCTLTLPSVNWTYAKKDGQEDLEKVIHFGINSESLPDYVQRNITKFMALTNMTTGDEIYFGSYQLGNEWLSTIEDIITKHMESDEHLELLCSETELHSDEFFSRYNQHYCGYYQFQVIDSIQVHPFLLLV